jgi:hypothetical protein
MALCVLGLLILTRPRRRQMASAYDRAGNLWAITAPAWCAADADDDEAIRIRQRLGRGQDPQLPAGWRLEPREDTP